jgi:hypothetical protein
MRFLYRACALLAVVAIAIACSSSDFKSYKKPSPRPTVVASTQVPACIELVVRANTSPNVAVPGGLACYSDAQQQLIRDQIGATTDEAIAAYAAVDPIYTNYEACGQGASGYWYFDLTNSAIPTDHRGLRLMADASGKVAGGGFSPGHSTQNYCQQDKP